MKKLPLRRVRTRSSHQTRATSGQHYRCPHDADLIFYAHSTCKAAKKLAAQIDDDHFSFFDAYSILHLYRHAAELFLKAIALGNGANFLPSRPDPISVTNSKSVSWLSQFLLQIVTILGWEQQLRCDEVPDIPAFRRMIEKVNNIEIGHPLFPLPNRHSFAHDLRQLIRSLDALLDLLASTADALSVEWDLRSAGAGIVDEWPDDTDFKPTIQ
jgi:hypothetical protein